MKTSACLPTVLSAALSLVLVVVLPGAAAAVDGASIGLPGTGMPGGGIPESRVLGTGAVGPEYVGTGIAGTGDRRDPRTGTTQLNEPNRANYFVDYHLEPGTPTTGGSFVNSDDPNNLRERVDRRSDDPSTRDPFALELRRFRGENTIRFR